jgi:predicted nucleotidyltransferase
MNSDFKELLRIFGQERVRYLIVGGYAVAKHAEPRYTKDLDIWVDNSEENAELVFKALNKFGAPLTNITAEDFTYPDIVFQMGIEPSRIDILMGVEVLTFNECWERKSTAVIDGTEIYFVSIDDLILNKRAVARPQDMVDVENLETKKRAQSTIDVTLPTVDQ